MPAGPRSPAQDSLLALFSRPHPAADSPQHDRPAAPPAPLDHDGHQEGPRQPAPPIDRRGSDLLSLLQGTSSPSPSGPLGSPHGAADSGRLPSPSSPPGGNARQLLGLLMGNGSPVAKSPVTAVANGGRPSSTTTSIQPPPPPPPLSSVPSHVRAQSPTSGSDTSEATTSTSVRAPVVPPAAADGVITHEHLAAQCLSPDAASSPPDTTFPGLRLPRSAHPPTEPQHLSISLADAHADSLAPSLPPTTPITLLSLPGAFPGAQRAAGLWEGGIAYATGGGKGRVRVIDRESGARVLLKGSKSGDVKELRVAPGAVGGRRRIATVSEEGVAAVWEVADSFGSEGEADARRVRDAALPASARLVRFNLDPSSQTLAIVCRDSTIHFVSLSGDAEPRKISVDGDVVDAAFSAAGAQFVVVGRDGRYTLYSTQGLSATRTGVVPLAEGAQVDQLAVLEPADSGGPAALAISSQQGTHVSLVTLDRDAEPSDITFTAPPGTPNFWGQVAYHAPTQSLLVSNSLRGSIYSFRLAFPTTPSQNVRIAHVLEQPTAEPVIGFVLDALPSADPPGAASSSAAPYAVSPKTSPVTTAAFGALVLHPRGVSHISLVGTLPRASSRPASPSTAGTTTDDDELGNLAALTAGRRTSLEGSIYVASEVSVRVDEPETDELSLKAAVQPGGSSSPARSPVQGNEAAPPATEALALEPLLPKPLADVAAQEPALGDLGNGIGGARTPVAELAPSPASSGADGIRLAGPVVNAAIRSMKARQQQQQQQQQQAGPASPAALTSGENGAVAGKEREKDADVESAVVRELRRIETVLPDQIGKAVSRELDKHVSHLEQHSAASATASTSRDDALVAAVQQNVTVHVARAVEGVVASQVGGVVERAVRAQMGRSVEEAIARALPLELEKQLNRPALSFALSSSIATTIAPPLERHLTSTLVKLVVPALEAKLSTAVDNVLGSIRMEMVDVRKEVVQEQSGAVRILEDEVASLREEVSTLKAMMEQMHSLVLKQGSEHRSARAAAASPRVPQQPPSLAAPPHGQQQQQQQQQQQHRHVSQPFVNVSAAPDAHHPLRRSQPASSSTPPTVPVAMHALPPIPRAATPPERYEELFTEAMQPQHEPSFVSLQHLVASSPLSRLDAVFPPPPALPKITMAVVLSLAYRLSQVVAERQGPLDDEGKKQLLWLRKAIAACDGKQPPELLALIPRILTNVVDNLSVRGRALVALHDHAGANDVRLVHQYAHARLSLFVRPGLAGQAQGGFEEFRR
ncbi:Proteophosphoglycan ppg4 [Rhodotorula diobovata]|uniref:Proteophosphoglycan ppg4 n=1 Tax=Rhodotorula diobovata TaxID=5288 RepID=A0A5C5FZT6_9BASI|nr:Proteophosphoglycan ppg4 [Rhodotorula diobovata]